jgi:hypothetical protein
MKDEFLNSYLYYTKKYIKLQPLDPKKYYFSEYFLKKSPI